MEGGITAGVTVHTILTHLVLSLGQQMAMVGAITPCGQVLHFFLYQDVRIFETPIYIY